MKEYNPDNKELRKKQIELSLTLRSSIAAAIIPHHLSTWKVEDLLGSFDFLKDLKYENHYTQYFLQLLRTPRVNFP